MVKKRDQETLIEIVSTGRISKIRVRSSYLPVGRQVIYKQEVKVGFEGRKNSAMEINDLFKI